MKKIIIRLGIVVALLIIVALVVVFFSLNGIVKKGVETLGPELTKVEVRLGAADISPFPGTGKLSKLFVGNPQGYKTPSAIEVGSVKVAVKIGSLLSDTIVVDEIDIQAPELTLESTITGNSNLGKILDNLSGPTHQKPETPAKKSEKKFVVKDVVINGAKVNIAVIGLGQLDPLVLPPVHLQNIGTENKAVTAEELVQQILEPLLQSAIQAGKKAITSGDKSLQTMERSATNDLKSTAKGLEDLFKKK
jgi:uncharacterized protein involved in outer membrane biogenesis